MEHITCSISYVSIPYSTYANSILIYNFPWLNNLLESVKMTNKLSYSNFGGLRPRNSVIAVDVYLLVKHEPMETCKTPPRLLP